jgi:AbrB family looped-hinge helix DNA binding protein
MKTTMLGGKMQRATVSEKGWVVIPKQIRDRLGLTKGSKVDFVELGGRVYLLPALEDPIRQGRGMFKGLGTMAEYMEEKRRERAEEEAELDRL